MEAVEDVQGVGATFADYAQVRFPHVRADELDLLGEVLADHVEELTEALNGAFLADPQQACRLGIDLIDERQIFVAPSVLDLIDTDGTDRPQGTLTQSPLHDILDGQANLVPGSLK